MKKLAKHLISVAALSVGSLASAATFSGGVLEYGETERIELGKNGAINYDFSFAGGSIFFQFLDDDPEDSTSSLTLLRNVNGTYTEAIFTKQVFDFKKNTPELSTFTAEGLLSGLYRLVLGDISGDDKNAKLDVYGVSGISPVVPDVSPVPLPGAALLFASSMLGAGALRRRAAKGKAKSTDKSVHHD